MKPLGKTIQRNIVKAQEMKCSSNPKESEKEETGE